ncbi:MAG: DUF2958 domain-containing protein [Deltaproteobacteria bacterium]|nr:DUF2958 domain-containing protein [Deltaproteobacteria bacterium]
MWNIPTKERLAKIPRLYETEHINIRDKMIHLHFFIGSCDWYAAEYDGEDLFWGFAILNGDLQNAEWGFVSFNELKNIKIDGWLEIDCELEDFFPIQRASEVVRICEAHGWIKEAANG